MKNSPAYKKSLFLVFFICIIYWAYLIFSASIQVSCDAKSYEDSGLAISRNGLKGYLESGPNREPLYPIIIAFSIKIASLFGIPYYCIQKITQVFILFSTQLLVIFLLSRVQVNKLIILVLIAYIGFSPSLVNSALSLFSEIATYPFVLGIILLAVISWRKILSASYSRIALLACGLASLFIGATFVKGIFQYIFFIFLLPFVMLFLYGIKSRNRDILKRVSLYLIISFVFFNLIFNSYKWLNLKYNGNFEFTTRYGSLLYGNAVKRTEKLTLRMFLAHVAYVPGEGIARMFFTPEEVRYCSFEAADYIRGKIINTSERECIGLAWQRFLKNPLQYFIFMGIEGMHMFFWESTNLGFVEYPLWLQYIFSFGLFKNGIRLAVSLLTLISFIWLLLKVIRERRLIYDFKTDSSKQVQVYFFIALLIVSFIGLHSFFSILTRYALPLAPLYLINIGCFLNRKLVIVRLLIKNK
jgi:hypothetical protein